MLAIFRCFLYLLLSLHLLSLNFFYSRLHWRFPTSFFLLQLRWCALFAAAHSSSISFSVGCSSSSTASPSFSLPEAFLRFFTFMLYAAHKMMFYAVAVVVVILPRYSVAHLGFHFTFIYTPPPFLYSEILIKIDTKHHRPRPALEKNCTPLLVAILSHFFPQTLCSLAMHAPWFVVEWHKFPRQVSADFQLTELKFNPSENCPYRIASLHFYKICQLDLLCPSFVYEARSYSRHPQFTTPPTFRTRRSSPFPIFSLPWLAVF